jgi:hypothetical protein
MLGLVPRFAIGLPELLGKTLERRERASQNGDGQGDDDLSTVCSNTTSVNDSANRSLRPHPQHPLQINTPTTYANHHTTTMVRYLTAPPPHPTCYPAACLPSSKTNSP